MNAYNNTTTIQESRNSYNELLNRALRNINRNKSNKTAQEPEEVTTAPTGITAERTYKGFRLISSDGTEILQATRHDNTEDAPITTEPVATTEEVTTQTTQEQPEQVTAEYYGYLDGKTALQAGRIKKQLDRRIFVGGKTCTWAEYIAEGYEAGQLKAYKDEYTYDKKGRDLAYHEHRVTEWVIWTAREMERGNGVVANKTIVDYALYLVKLMEETAPEYTIPLDDLIPATAPQATEEDTATVPEEVTTVTTSKQEDDTTPYWLLLDNELRAQQQEQAPATPEKSEEEPMHAPQMLKKMIEEHKKRIKDGTATESIYNADALQAEVLTPKRAKELLGGCFSNYKNYILVDGTHIVETERPTLKSTLYIDDESPEYKEYQRGNISAVELYRDDMISMYGSKGKIKTVEDNPATLTVDSARYKVLSFNLYRRADYVYRRANPDEVEIYKAAMRANHEAFSKRLDSYIRRYGKKIYVHSYWANR